jgi:hypothetical protein
MMGDMHDTEEGDAPPLRSSMSASFARRAMSAERSLMLQGWERAEQQAVKNTVQAHTSNTMDAIARTARTLAARRGVPIDSRTKQNTASKRVSWCRVVWRHAPCLPHSVDGQHRRRRQRGHGRGRALWPVRVRYAQRAERHQTRPRR